MTNLNKRRIVAYVEPRQFDWLDMKKKEVENVRDPITQKPAGVSFVLRKILTREIDGK